MIWYLQAPKACDNLLKILVNIYGRDQIGN